MYMHAWGWYESEGTKPHPSIFPTRVTTTVMQITPQVERKKYIVNNEWMNEWMNAKPPKYMCMSNVLACLSQPERTYWSLTPQLDTVIIEESSVKALSLRGNPWRLCRAKHLPSQNGTYGDTGFYSAQTTYLSMKVLTFAKNENIRFFFKLLLTWVMIKNVDTSVTTLNFILTCSSGGLYNN